MIFTRGNGKGGSHFGEFSLVKHVDSRSAGFMLHCCDGTHYGEAVVTIRQALPDDPVEYMSIQLFDMRMTSINFFCPTEDDSRLTEQLTFSFTKVEMDYMELGPSGKMHKVGWDIREGQSE